MASPCTVSLILIRLEWGSVQMNEASTNLTFVRPFKRRKQMASNSLDSNSALIHCPGGYKNLSQFLQNEMFASLGIP